AGGFALSLVALQEAGHEELLGEGRQSGSSRLAVTDHLVGLIEVDHLEHRAGLRRVIGNLVTIFLGHRLAAGKAHQGIAVRRRHVDTTYVGRPAEKFLDAELSPLRRELGPAGENTSNPRFAEATPLRFEFKT